MRTMLVYLGVLLWLGASLAWLLPRQHALVRKHGVHPSNHDLNRLAAQDREAWNLHRDTWIMVIIGLVGGIAIVGSA